MRVGVVADIHANSVALSVVVDELHNQGIETVIVAGDTVGYYYNILEVRDLLSDFNLFEVRGNHEDRLLSDCQSELEEYEKKYGSGLRRNKLDLNGTGLDYVRNLNHPLEINLIGRKIMIAHGSPWDINEYIYPNSNPLLWERFLELETDILILGHTHHQMFRKIDGVIIINPGSVGQNRSARSMADWAIIDLLAMSVEFRTTPYSSHSLVDQCNKYDPGLDILTRHLLPEQE
jgi:putative phosphoesterase